MPWLVPGIHVFFQVHAAMRGWSGQAEIMGRLAGFPACAIAALIAAMPARSHASEITKIGMDFVEICGAAVMQPRQLSKVLATRGLQIPPASHEGSQSQSVIRIAAKDQSWNMMILETVFSDLRIKVCELTAPKLLVPDELKQAKERLEASSGVGKFEGEFKKPEYAMIAASFGGMFKRPGNNPSLLLEMNSVRMPSIREKKIQEMTLLRLHRFDFSEGK